MKVGALRSAAAAVAVPMAIALAAHVASARQQGTKTPPQPDESGWKVVWADEFDKPGLPDPAKWSYELGGNGWGNRELQFYTDARRENARVEDGKLIVEARREEWQGSHYTSARLNSRPGWTYGRIEVRAKLPRGRGTWPAIWMLPVRGSYAKGGWPDNGEIDIMEHVGFDPGVIHGTIHTRAYNHVDRTQRGETTTVADAQDAFHVYAVEWTPQLLTLLRRQHRVLLVRQRASRQSEGGLAAMAVRQRLPHPRESRRRRQLGWTEGRRGIHLAAAARSRLHPRVPTPALIRPSTPGEMGRRRMDLDSAGLIARQGYHADDRCSTPPSIPISARSRATPSRSRSISASRSSSPRSGRSSWRAPARSTSPATCFASEKPRASSREPRPCGLVPIRATITVMITAFILSLLLQAPASAQPAPDIRNFLKVTPEFCTAASRGRSTSRC